MKATSIVSGNHRAQTLVKSLDTTKVVRTAIISPGVKLKTPQGVELDMDKVYVPASNLAGTNLRNIRQNHVNKLEVSYTTNGNDYTKTLMIVKEYPTPRIINGKVYTHELVLGHHRYTALSNIGVSRWIFDVYEFGVGEYSEEFSTITLQLVENDHAPTLVTSDYEIANAILKLIACNELDSTEDAIRTYLETYVPNSHHMTKSKVVKQVCNRTTIYRRVVTWDYANLVKAVSNVKYYAKGVARYIIGGIFDKKRNAVGWSVGEGYTYDYVYNALMKFYNEGKKSYFIHHVKTPTKKQNLAQKRAKIIKLIAEEEKAMIKAVEYYKENGVFPWYSEAFIFQDNENGEEGFLSIRDAIKDSKTGRVADLDDPLTESEIKMVTGEKEE